MATLRTSSPAEPILSAKRYKPIETLAPVATTVMMLVMSPISAIAEEVVDTGLEAKVEKSDAASKRQIPSVGDDDSWHGELPWSAVVLRTWI